MARSGKRDETKRPSMLDKDAATLADNLLEPATMQAIYEETRATLEDGVDGENLIRAAARASLIASDVWSDLEEEGPAYDCRKGCSWCCHQTVMVVAPEVFVVLTYLRRHRSAEELVRLREHLARRSGEIVGKTTGQRMADALACGFLEDGACSVHPARPMPCHGGFSQDEAVCRRLFEDYDAELAEITTGRREMPFLLVPKMVFNSAQVGMVTALRDHGYACPPLELTVAMRIALEHEDVVAAWLEDESVFAEAELREVDGQYVTSAAGRPFL